MNRDAGRLKYEPPQAVDLSSSGVNGGILSRCTMGNSFTLQACNPTGAVPEGTCNNGTFVGPHTCYDGSAP